MDRQQAVHRNVDAWPEVRLEETFQVEAAVRSSLVDELEVEAEIAKQAVVGAGEQEELVGRLAVEVESEERSVARRGKGENSILPLSTPRFVPPSL